MSCGPFKFGSSPSKCGQFLKWMYCRLPLDLAGDLGCRSGVYYEQPLHNPEAVKESNSALSFVMDQAH
jgi:hypothetical protein